MPSVAFICSDWVTQLDPPEPNGCAYMRQVLPARVLPAFGWETAVGLPRVHNERGIGLAHLDGALFGWDVNVFKLMMHASTPDLFKAHQRNNEKVVVDIDDFHFALHSENVAALGTHPHTNPESNRAFYEIGIRQADTVTVSTAFLANFYSARCRDVRLVRNALDVERYKAVRHDDRPVYGWVGATLWRSGDLELLREWLPQFVKDFGVQVHHSGHIPNDAKHFAVRAGLSRVSTNNLSLVKDYPALLNFHVGLVPLTMQPFNEAKSNLKGLEYAAAGIPFIASPTEEYRLLHEAGIGRLASTPEEWRDHAIELLDVNVRKEEATRQRKLVQKNWSMRTKGKEWHSALLG